MTSDEGPTVRGAVATADRHHRQLRARLRGSFSEP